MQPQDRPELTLVKGAPPRDRWLDIAGVRARVGCGPSWIYDAIKNKGFPAPIKLSARCSRWSEAEILSWMANQTSREAA